MSPRHLDFSPALQPRLRDLWEERESGVPPYLRQFFALCEQLLGNVRHIGIHNGGEIISDAPLSRRLPTEPASMDGRTVVQWDKEALEDAGIIKIDVLGLKMLAAISEMVERTGIDAETIPFDDRRVYQMITAAKTFGVFQCESRAQMNTLPRFETARLHRPGHRHQLDPPRSHHGQYWCIPICGGGAAQKPSSTWTRASNQRWKKPWASSSGRSRC